MFRFHKPLDIITLFHKPSITASTRALRLLKQASVSASESIAADQQASDHTTEGTHTRAQRTQFNYDVTEDPPTTDQLRNIMDYLGGPGDAGQGQAQGGRAWNPAELVEGATDRMDAVKKCQEDPRRFRRPVMVDWNNGKAVIGGDESKILKLLYESPSGTHGT